MDSNIIRDLVAWVECHLEDHLQLDDIAEKSGYSKWHLQRAFKETAKITLGTYVRYRRLSKVAMDLRLTNNSMVDIATKYCFDSPQSFSRAFKRHFKISPGVYRRSEEWITTGILPALYDDTRDTPATGHAGSTEATPITKRSPVDSMSLSNLPCSDVSDNHYEFIPLSFHKFNNQNKCILNSLYINENEDATSDESNTGQKIKKYFDRFSISQKDASYDKSCWPDMSANESQPKNHPIHEYKV